MAPPVVAPNTLEESFRKSARWAGVYAFSLGSVFLFVGVGTAAADTDFPRAFSLILGLFGAVLTGLGALTWSRRVWATRVLAGVGIVWLCCQIIGLIVLVVSSRAGTSMAGPGLGFFLSVWLVQLCGKALEPASKLRKELDRRPERGRFPWVGLGVTTVAVVALVVLVLVRESSPEPSRPEMTARKMTSSPHAIDHGRNWAASDEPMPVPAEENEFHPSVPDLKEAHAKAPAPGSESALPKAGAVRPVRLSDLKVERTTMDPPAVTFSVRIDLGGAELLETWASVDVADPGEVLKIFAGALHQGLLSFTIDGMTIDLANPSPSLKAQRVRLKKSESDPNVYVGEVMFPKVKAQETTTFAVLLAAQSGSQVVQSNAVTCRVNLKTGKVER